MSKSKVRLENHRQAFYLTFFNTKEGYEEKEVNGYFLVKHWNGNTKEWVVALYSKESMNNLKNAKVPSIFDCAN